MTYSVVVLMYHRTPELTTMAQECISSITSSSEDYELIVIDNGSTENTDWVRASTDTFIRFDGNRGIAHAWNTGLRISRGEFIVVCNDDILVYPGWLSEMRKAASQFDAAAGAVHVEHLPPGKGLVPNYKWFPGSCFMLPKRTIKRIGYFDEQFWPCNWEDTDYWTRCLQAGLQLYVNYDAPTIQHKEGQTLHVKDLSDHFLTNKQRYIDKHGKDCTSVFYGNQSFLEWSRS